MLRYRVVDDTVPHLLDTFRPDLVLYDAGVDPHVLDDLGKLAPLFLFLLFSDLVHYGTGVNPHVHDDLGSLPPLSLFLGLPPFLLYNWCIL